MSASLFPSPAVSFNILGISIIAIPWWFSWQHFEISYLLRIIACYFIDALFSFHCQREYIPEGYFSISLFWKVSLSTNMRPGKIVEILQTIFSNAYSQVKNLCILIKIPLNFFLLVLLTKRHRTLRKCHDPKQAKSRYLNQEWLIVIYICVNRHRRVNVYISNYVTTDVYVHFHISSRTWTRT